MTMTDLEACAADHEAPVHYLGDGFCAIPLSDGGLLIRGEIPYESVMLTPAQTAKLRSISAAAIAAGNRARDERDWRAVKLLCEEVRAEIDGDKPIHSTDMQNALEAVERLFNV